MAVLSKEVRVSIAKGVLRSQRLAESLVGSLAEDVTPEEVLIAARARAQDIIRMKESTQSGTAAAEQRRELIYAVRSLAFCGIPYDDPKAARSVSRMIRMPLADLQVTYSSKKEGVSVVFGSDDRRFFAWICTAAIKARSNKIILGDDIADAIREIGWAGGTAWDTFYGCVMRWRSCSIEMELFPRDGDKIIPIALGGQTGLIKAWHLPRIPDHKAAPGTPYYLELSLDFWEVLQKEPFPVPMEYLKPFATNALGWDFAYFIAARVAAGKSVSRIPLFRTGKVPNSNILTLMDQFGSKDSNPHRWVSKLKKHLLTIKTVWKDLDADIVDGKVLVVRPSPYMVPYTGTRGGFLSAFEDYAAEQDQKQPPLFDDDIEGEKV